MNWQTNNRQKQKKKKKRSYVLIDHYPMQSAALQLDWKIPYLGIQSTCCPFGERQRGRPHSALQACTHTCTHTCKHDRRCLCCDRKKLILFECRNWDDAYCKLDELYGPTFDTDDQRIDRGPVVTEARSYFPTQSNRTSDRSKLQQLCACSCVDSESMQSQFFYRSLQNISYRQLCDLLNWLFHK